MGEEPLTRAELVAPYEHPYRRALPVLMDVPEIRNTLVVGLPVAGVSAAIGLFEGTAAWLLLAGIAAAVTAVVCAVWILAAARMIWRQTREWDRPAELEDVRVTRPHAPEHDAQLSHAEYAVSVEDTGELFVWRFVPLGVGQTVPDAMLEVAGRPRHGAEVVEQHALDVGDTARAAEQLVEAQARAAELEGVARDRAAHAFDERHRQLALDAEAESAAASLRHLTGQSGRSRRH